MKFLCVLFSLVLLSCGSREIMEVQTFHLQEHEVGKIDSMVRGEMNKRLYGAVSTEERNNRLGQYYDIHWSQLSGTAPIRLTFEYRQAATGVKIQKLEQTLPAAPEGKGSFHIIGESYQTKGRILAWRISLYEGSELRAVKRSYLWE